MIMPKDRFSQHANQYAAFRPTYPNLLYDFIFSQVKNFDYAWDAGTGNGQVARDLCRHFKKVYATDISKKQLENAHVSENIVYSTAGETTPFPEKYFDLVTVAQAIHWFDREKFYAEVKRVAKPNAVVAIWGYGLLSITNEIDPMLNDFYVNIIGQYWDKERKLIDEEFKTIDFPFREIGCPKFSFSAEWTIDQFHGYLTTWSSVQKFIHEKQFNPADELISRINSLWRSEKLNVQFPLFMRIGLA
ncbi:MAG: class I SAM-dependent methyltransferase [Bacteroidetes bacterium]|nr:class I SAM-dependent methyltransferase [Bacteroidota bacterium]MBS1982374.1 class I SAM-dependent methyltransferase [Bacteroidota bacterium]